jgi:hypothetical protein
MCLKTAFGERRREDISQTEVSKSMLGNLRARLIMRGIWIREEDERVGGAAPKDGRSVELWRGREMCGFIVVVVVALA